MVECKYRIAVDKSKGKASIEAAMDKAMLKTGFHRNVFAGQLRQTFDCGLCELLTQNDIGPMKCQQPEHNEQTCPDIDHLRQ